MRQYDLSPLYRSTVGFDRLFTMLDQVSGNEAAAGYPPYNIERTGEHDYRISVAVAGFAEEDLSIEAKENTLTIRGSKEPPAKDSSANPAEVQPSANAEARREVLYRGIAARAFERRFQLADHVQVVGAVLQHGLLHVDLVREIPEAQKPRRIVIGRPGVKAVEAQRAA